MQGAASNICFYKENVCDNVHRAVAARNSPMKKSRMPRNAVVGQGRYISN